MRMPIVLVAALSSASLGVAGATARETATSVPRPLAPAGGALVAGAPVFGWSQVRGADHYEFQIAADSSFDAPVFGRGRDSYTTSNTWATLQDTIPNGRYWWHVRAVDKQGSASAWSRARAIRKSWAVAPRLLAPSNGAAVSFPSAPLTLRWSAVPGAVTYRVTLSTAQDLSSIVGGRPVETSATAYTPSFIPAAGTAPKTYYWSVTPADADGHEGAASRVGRFAWGWSSATKARVADLRAEPETVDPEFSWDPVMGAAAYELEVNPTHDFAAGSRVCCSKPVIGTSWSPTVALPDNTYYWRVRAIDVSGNAGVWSTAADQGRFDKVFDKAASLQGASIRNLHMRDNVSDPAPPGPTAVPVAVWDPVPGAASYFVEVVPFTGGFCDWNAQSPHWRSTTATTAWTPLGSGLRAPEPYPDKLSPVTDSPGLGAGRSYCLRVRAQADRDTGNSQLYGDFTYLNGNDRPAFTFSGFSSASRAYLTASDYVLPRGAQAAAPLFTWRPSRGSSWFVLVAKDPQFHTIVDYAFTQVPAYAPRTGTRPTTYTDESTAYYWAVLPAADIYGRGAVGDPLGAAPQSFNKQSKTPGLLAPADRSSVTGMPTFRWTPVDGTLRYHLQVSQSDDFSKLIDDVTTTSVAYTASTSYPPDVALHWRVRSEDVNGVGLTWSIERTFRYHLPAPAPLANAGSGQGIPTWRWAAVAGATGYDVHVDLPNGSRRDFPRLPSAAFTATRMTGTGIFRWRVRATFPTGVTGSVAGPYSRPATFVHALGAPGSPATLSTSRGVLLRWSPKLGAKSYVVQIAASSDLAATVESGTVDGNAYAPMLRRSSRTEAGKRLWWRVAAVDADGNQGKFTKPVSFRILRRG